MPTSSTNKDIVQELQEILRQWEEDQNVSTSDPTPLLVKLCELFEREIINFLKKDPDPFDDRHPVTSKPDCALGQILRALFKKEAFVNKLVGHYLRDNYFSSQGLTQSSYNLNVASCRLLLDLLHGLDIPQVFRNSETAIVARLFTWAENGEEPLATYAIGLLGAAMDIEEIPTNFKDNNARLVPILLNRLWDMKNNGNKDQSHVPERPFAHLGKTEANMPNGNDKVIEGTRKRPAPLGSPIRGPNESGTFNMFGTPKTMRLENPSNHDNAGGTSISPGISHIQSDCSNSSWAEMSSYIVGTYQMSPINDATKQMFILKYLRPVGEYQEILGHIYEHNALDLIFYLMNIKNTNNARLSFESLRFLGSLLFHKKFCLEFVNMSGVEKLLQVPRPSLPSSGVALCLWYLAFCEEAVEKICVLPNSILTDLIRYALWLMESSHQSSCTHAVMFFGMVFKFRALLEKFDEQDGLRKMLNTLSTKSIFQENWDQEMPDEPNESMTWQTVKQVCLSVKCYLEAHLALRVMQLQHAHSGNNPTIRSTLPSFKAMPVTSETVEKNVEYLLENLPLRARWKAIEQFINLKGLKMFLQLVAIVFQDSYSINRTETAEYTLESLYVCSVMPIVQAALCDKVTIPSGDQLLSNSQPREVPGYAILVACIPETSDVLYSPEIQKAALSILINCVSGPIHRPGSIGNTKPVSTPGSKKKFNTSEEIIKKSWDCVQTSNGIMYLLNLLQKKTPIIDADEVRALACRALVGLSRSESARQIMSKLPIFSSGQLQLLMREPVLQDKRIEHGRFQRSALELIEAISGRSQSDSAGGSSDITIQSIHRADVVAQTKIQFNRKQLLQLIQSYLVNEGFESVATALQKEAHLPPIPPKHNMMAPPLRTSSTPTMGRSSRLLDSNISKQLFSPSLNKSQCNGILTSPSTKPSNSAIQIRLNKKSKLDRSSSESLSNSNSPSISPRHFEKRDDRLPASPTICVNPIPGSSQGRTKNLHALAGRKNMTVAESGISLEGIVKEYLTSQHALCKNPVVTCPTFDLFQPHRCPEPKVVRAVPNNFTMRYLKYPYLSSKQSYGYPSMNRKFIYSRYRPSHLFKPPDNDEVFLCCEFTPDDQFILVGTTKGEVRMYNKTGNSDEGVYSVHNTAVSALQPHSSGNLLLTSASASHESSLWTISDLFHNKFTISDCDVASFSHRGDKILGTSEQTAKLYDLETKKELISFTPKLSNHYRINQAALDPTDELILTDGVLFDCKSGKQLHKFDKINHDLNGIFHRNGLEIISSSEIWDLRTFHLLRTVPALNYCDISFNKASDVIFGITIVDFDENQDNAYETSFKTVDAVTYSSIATVDVRRIVTSLAINPTDTQIAVVESDNADDLVESAVVRLYEIGMSRNDAEEVVDDDDDDDLGSDEEDSDDSSDDPDQPNNSGDDLNMSDDSNSSGADDGLSIFSIDDGDEEDEDDDQEPFDESAVRSLLGYLGERALRMRRRPSDRNNQGNGAASADNADNNNDNDDEDDDNDDDEDDVDFYLDD